MVPGDGHGLCGSAGASKEGSSSSSSSFPGLLGCSNVAEKASSSSSRSPVGSLDLVSRVLFPTPKCSYSVEDFPGELIWVPRSLNPQTCTPEECIPCLFLLSPSARFLIFYLHSNAEDLGQCYSFCTLLRHQFQAHVLAVEYPGYGLCPGQADEETVTENAFTAFRFIREVLCWPLDGILILGRSIGTGPALAIASKNEVYGVILISPFLSVKEVVKGLLGPFAYFMADRFPNQDRVHRLRSPLLIVHGKLDKVVPTWHGENLYHACKSRKRLVVPDAMHHNSNLYSDPNFFVLPMLQFFALPDFCFEDPRLPAWAFDKRLSTHYNATAENTSVVVVGLPVADNCKLESCQKPSGLPEDLDVLPAAVEDAASAAVTKFLNRTGLPALAPGRADMLPVAEAPRSLFEPEPEEGHGFEEAAELPEPACEGVFLKVPRTHKSGPALVETDDTGVDYSLVAQRLLVSI